MAFNCTPGRTSRIQKIATIPAADQKEAEVPPKQLRICHAWLGPYGKEQFYVCRACGTRRRSNLDADECEGARPFLGKALQSSTGHHRLWVVAVVEREGEMVVLCAACGRRDTGVSSRTPFWAEQCHGACTRKPEESKKRFFWDAASRPSVEFVIVTTIATRGCGRGGDSAVLFARSSLIQTSTHLDACPGGAQAVAVVSSVLRYRRI